MQSISKALQINRTSHNGGNGLGVLMHSVLNASVVLFLLSHCQNEQLDLIETLLEGGEQVVIVLVHAQRKPC